MLLDPVVSYREISEKYNISQASLYRYVKDYMMDAVREALKRRQLEAGEFVLSHIGKALEMLEKQRDAIDRWLTDPENEDRYSVEPRASEIDVVYERVRESDDKVVRDKDTLHNLLERIQSNLPIDVVSVSIKSHDIRKLMLDTLNSEIGQLKLLMQVQEKRVQEAEEAAVEHMVEILQQVIGDMAAERPEIREIAGEIFAGVDQAIQSSDQ